MSEYNHKEEIEDCIDALEIAHIRIDSVLERNKVLESQKENLEKKVGNLENRLTTVSGYITEIMKRLALMTVLQSTHREKNAKIAEFVRNLHNVERILELPANQDTDDIPF